MQETAGASAGEEESKQRQVELTTIRPDEHDASTNQLVVVADNSEPLGFDDPTQFDNMKDYTDQQNVVKSDLHDFTDVNLDDGENDDDRKEESKERSVTALE